MSTIEPQRWPPPISPGAAALSGLAILAALALFLLAAGYLCYRASIPSQPSPTQPAAAQPAFDTAKAFTDFRALQDQRQAVAQECGYVSKTSKIHSPICENKAKPR